MKLFMEKYLATYLKIFLIAKNVKIELSFIGAFYTGKNIVNLFET